MLICVKRLTTRLTKGIPELEEEEKCLRTIVNIDFTKRNECSWNVLYIEIMIM